MSVTPPTELTYRDDFSGPEDRAEVYRLLRDTFDVDVSPLQELNLWDPTYRAFSYLDVDGRCVANVATFSLKLVVNGRRVNAMGIQSVATRPAWRGRGLSHDLLRRALLWCDANAPLAYLMTSIPGFYEPLGFRTLPQSKYVGEIPSALPSPRRGRKLQFGSREDRELLVRVLRRRTPVSARFAVDGSQGAFALNLLDQAELASWYLPHHEAVVVTAEQPNGTLCIIDVAAPKMPNLREVLAGLGAVPTRLEVHFPPDQLGWTGVAVPAETETMLMVRGDPGQLDPFMLPETAAF